MTRAEARSQSRAQVLEIATACFLENGIDNTSIAEIAARSGLTSMSVYRYFGTKQNLTVEVANSLLASYLEEHRALCAAGAHPGETGFEEFARTVRNYVDVFAAHPEYIRIVQELSFYAQRENLSDRLNFLRFAETGDDPAITPARKALWRGQADGSVRPGIDWKSVCLTLVNLLIGGVNFHVLVDEKTEIDIIRNSAEMIIFYTKAPERSNL